ncbi:MAG: squalene/phytoene synthase family protein [Candidatus Eremiobacteraeota bacterium]|nr:squalene/phytoene synthase family protein [Candidatus Eremiobacteraeota bacterium]
MRGKGSELDAADRHCQTLATRHYENFAVSSRFLAPRVRVDLMRVYAFCRTTDDLGDESGAQALRRLARWRAEVEGMFRGDLPVHPVLIALRETVERRSLPQQPFLDLIAANEQDQRVSTYGDWPSLRAYCLLSAAPVGRIVLQIFELFDPALQALSDDVCIGLQLANFAQDESRDARIGRRYLIGAEVDTLGVTGATRAMCERARMLLSSGRILERAAPLPLRIQLSLYRLGGLAICDAIARQGYETVACRPKLGRRAKLGVLLRAARETLAATVRAHRAQPA